MVILGRTLIPHELVNELVVSELRGIVAHRLRERGFGQLKIAKLLGISQPMVSRYISVGFHEYLERLRRLGLDPSEVLRVVDMLVEKLVSGDYYEYLRLLSSFVNSLLKRGSLCDAHRKSAPLIPSNCDLCFKLFEEVTDPYVEEVRIAYELFSLHPRGHEIVPEVGMNIVSAPPSSSDLRDVVGFSGRIICVHNKVVAAGEPVRGGSKHTASVLLKVMRKFPNIRSAVVIKYSHECLQKLVSAGLYVVRTGPHSSGAELFTVLEKTVESLQKEPDVIADAGGLGLEPVMYVFAVNAVRAVKKALICSEK